MRLVDRVRLTACTESEISARVSVETGFYTLHDGETKAAYQSSLQCDFVQICDFANEVRSIHWKPFTLRFDDLIDGKERSYTPDYLVETVDDEGCRNTLIVEVKPEREIKAIWEQHPTGRAVRSHKAMLEWLYGKPRHRFLLISEAAMARQGLHNIKTILDRRTYKIPNNLRICLDQHPGPYPATLGNLAQLGWKQGASRGTTVSALLRLCADDHLFFDLRKPLDDSTSFQIGSRNRIFRTCK